MSIPSIPGYLGSPPGQDRTVAELWKRPPGDFPSRLWPEDVLADMCQNPTGWVTVEENFFTDARQGGAGCVLVRAKDSEHALAETSWIGSSLGSVGVWSDGDFDDGLRATDDEVNVEFFLHVRRPSGARAPVIEVSHTFLWYWDAFPVTDGWKYLNRAGREQDLIRWTASEDGWKVDVRALELRHFLAACDRVAVMQRDYVTKLDAPQFERVEDTFQTPWAHLSFYVMHDDGLMSSRPAFSGVRGKYLLTAMRTSRVPRWEKREQDRAFPEFLYGISSQTGEPLRHTCEPDRLGTYFDADGTRLHYLTPVYFSREVLQPYAAEPSKYRLSTSRLSCMDLWGLDISINSIGLVEVYLGDLGRDLPSDEWGHWLAYNVAPEGTMEEGRFRRDFLGQWASSRDVVGDLRRARETASEASTQVLAAPLWKPLAGQTADEFASLLGPLNDDPAALGPSFLLLTKVFVDGIDPAPLKAYLGDVQKDEGSLQLLRRFVEQLSGDPDVVAVLHALQRFRSRGGVAHLEGSGRAAAAEALGITGLASTEAFESVTIRLTEDLVRLADLMAARSTTRPT